MCFSLIVFPDGPTGSVRGLPTAARLVLGRVRLAAWHGRAVPFPPRHEGSREAWRGGAASFPGPGSSPLFPYTERPGVLCLTCQLPWRAPALAASPGSAHPRG